MPAADATSPASRITRQLARSYRYIAPLYDAFIATATRDARRRSLAPLAGSAPGAPRLRILVNGVGTGLDLPHLPPHHDYVGVDLTEAMLRRALPRSRHLHFLPLRGDAQRLPLGDGCCDMAILHLILAVVPDPAACLRETARVVRPGGSVLVFDKFLRPGERAPLRRLIHPIVRRLATGLDVVFEDVLAATADSQCQPLLHISSDQPALAGGWFRLIRLTRSA